MRARVSVCLVATVLSALVGQQTAAAKGNKLPSTFQRCSVTDAKMDECLKDAVQAVIPELVKGVPSLGVYSIDPLDLVAAEIRSSGGPVSLNLNFRNLRISGLHSAQIVSFKYDPKTYTMKLKAKTAVPVKLEGGYKINGKVLLLPIQGEGQCTLQLDDVTADIVIHSKEVMVKGMKHVEVQNLDLSFDTSKLRMYFENLFNGNKELGDNMNRFLNENWPDILRELKPSIDNTFGETFKAIANRIYLRVPLNNIFLP